MASLDGSKSLQSVSDELSRHVCGRCKSNEGSIKETKHFCGDCSEYLCDSCVENHSKLFPLTPHKIVGADTVKVNAGQPLTIYCLCKRNREVEFYCDEHYDVICSLCKIFKHDKCRTIPIEQKSSRYHEAKLESIILRIKSLTVQFGQLAKECAENKKELTLSKEICKQEIKTIRRHLDSVLDKMEQDILTELDKKECKLHQHLNGQMITLTTALQMLDGDNRTLTDSKTDGRRHIMFASEVQTSKGLQDYESRLEDMKKNVKKLTIKFKRNSSNISSFESIKHLGSLDISESTKDRIRKTVFLGTKIGSHREVNVRLPDDEKTPWITGCVVMPYGNIVMCDRNNFKLKLLDCPLSVIDSCAMPSGPWDVSVLDTNNVIVTVPEKMQLQQVQIFPQLKVGRVIQLDKMCWGVVVSGENIYVSYHNNPGDGEVRVFDKQGNLQRRLGVNRNGYFLFLRSFFRFKSPSYITVNRGTDKIFVSDHGTVTCMTADSRIVYQYTDTNLTGLCGLLCDDSNNTLVCFQGSNGVQVITAEGKLYGTILSSKDGLREPFSVAYRRSDNVLVVGCKSHDDLLVYQLTQ